MLSWRKSIERRWLIPLSHTTTREDALHILNDHDTVSRLFYGPRLVEQNGFRRRYALEGGNDSIVDFADIRDGLETHQNLGLGFEVIMQWRVVALDADYRDLLPLAEKQNAQERLALEEVIQCRCIRFVAFMLNVRTNTADSEKTQVLVRAIETRASDRHISQDDMIDDANKYIKALRGAGVSSDVTNPP